MHAQEAQTKGNNNQNMPNLNLFRAQQLYNSYKLFLGARRNGKRPSRIKKTAVYPGGQFTQEATSSVCPRVYAGEGDRPIDLSLHAREI